MLYEKNVQRGEIRTIIYGEKNCVLVGGSDSNVYCLNAKNGKVAYVVKPCFLFNVNGCSFKNVKVTDKSLIEILKTNGAAVWLKNNGDEKKVFEIRREKGKKF